METDFGSGAFLSNINTNPVGDEWRGIGADWFNAEDVAAEDWQRDQQAANNQMYRDLAVNDFNNKFNAQEAQKERDWSERMRDTSYISMMNQMKQTGINPILAYSSNAASAPSGASASASGGRTSAPSSKGNVANTASFGQLLVGVGKIVAGLVTANPGVAASGFSDTVLSFTDKHGIHHSVREREYNKK